ncbi:E3 ubiquitin-protein ligase parkin [Cimex lectularius]|uniref:E3 ubiquitin-protein ligase parkin n=1 Tax=Cimex lectularius TaxID=79782 RepID=A0A8I6RPY9_CIMLE|nr:E3 ubiquitin-protein ligase parkin [Cimex lectularius]
MMFMFDLLWDFWNSLLSLFSSGKKSLSNRLSVYIKSTKGDKLPVELDPKWDIKEVKEIVAPKLGLPPDNVEFILAGKLLDDSTIIEECDLGEQSILHMVVSKRDSNKSRPLNQTLAALEEENPGRDSPTRELGEKVHFYVFCSQCGPKGERPHEGKLRVRCATCGSGAITVDSDPASWSDVLEPKRISGHCEEENCPAGAVAWAEFYFKCAEHTTTNEKEEASSLHLIRPNSMEVPCLACTEIVSPVLVFPCSVGHCTCIPCFLRYCLSRLSERKFVLDKTIGYTLPCPTGCKDSLIAATQHFLLMKTTPQLYAQYQRFGVEDYVLQNGGVLCPQPNCGNGIFPDPTCDSVKCSSCGFVFCKKCLQGNHTGDCDEVPSTLSLIEGDSSYKIDPLKASQARWDEATKLTIRVKTKPCPKCRTATERSGGCMHMVCSRCDFEWCWVCQIGWTRDCMGSHWFG